MKEKSCTVKCVWGDSVFNCLLCCPPKNKQTSDYDINANLNVSQ